MRKRGWKRFLIVAISTLTAVAVGYDVGSKEPAERRSVLGGLYLHETSDLTPVQLAVEGPKGKAAFSIPKAYLSERKHWNGGPQWRIYIETANLEEPLPVYADRLYARLIEELGEPSTKNLAELRRRFTKAQFREWITITISYGHDFATTNKTLPETIKKWGRPAGKDGTFARYNTFSQGVVFDTYYVPLAQEAPPLFIECPNPELRGSPELVRCMAHSDYSELVSYTFTFQWKRLDEFRQLNQKVRRFIDNIEVAEHKTSGS